MGYKDYYQILGISRTASADKIRSAFRQLALRYHPDRNPGNKQSEEKFKEVNEAYQTLSDSKKRARYDQMFNYVNTPRSSPKPENINRGQRYESSASEQKSHPEHSPSCVEKIKIPSNIEISKDFRYLHIVRKWFHLKFILKFTSSLLSFPFIFMLFAWNFLSGISPAWLEIFYLLIIVSMVSYYFLAQCINKTYIEVNSSSIKITHGPIPFFPLWGDKEVPVKTLRMIFSEGNIVYFGRGKQHETPVFFHEVHAITTDCREITLIFWTQ